MKKTSRGGIVKAFKIRTIVANIARSRHFSAMHRSPAPSLASHHRDGIANRRTLLAQSLASFLAALSAGGSITLSTGCASPRRGEARRLLESIAKSNRRLAVASKQFGDVITSRLEEKASKDDVIKGLEKLKGVFDPLRKGIDEWIVPKSPEAESLVSTYRGHLDKRERILDEFGPRIVEILTTMSVPLAERPKKLGEIVAQMNKAEAESLASLKQAQRTYAASMGVFSYE